MKNTGIKHFSFADIVYIELTRVGLTRNDCIFALGGGVVADLAGLEAALYMRGIDWYNCLTTTLSMVDSSIGGKTAINFGGVKNNVGGLSPALHRIDRPRHTGNLTLETCCQRSVGNNQNGVNP